MSFTIPPTMVASLSVSVCLVHLIVSIAFLCGKPSAAFVHPQFSHHTPSQPLLSTKPTLLQARRNNDNVEGNSAAAGAVFGALMGGPFGMLFGAQIGASLGRKQATKKEMERLGLTPEMLAAAEECGVALERAVEGLEASRESYESLRRLASTLDTRNNDLYENARVKIESGDEEVARRLLMERQEVQDKLKATLLKCAEEKQRTERMQRNVNAIEERGLEIEALLKRSVGAKAMMDTSGMIDDLRLEDEDPLLRKFQDLENQ